MTDEAAIEFHDLIRQVMMAVMEVHRAGSADQLAQARAVLTQARRSLYLILAEDNGDAGPAGTERGTESAPALSRGTPSRPAPAPRTARDRQADHVRSRAPSRTPPRGPRGGRVRRRRQGAGHGPAEPRRSASPRASEFAPGGIVIGRPRPRFRPLPGKSSFSPSRGLARVPADSILILTVIGELLLSLTLAAFGIIMAAG